MAHIRVEYSANLEQTVNIADLLRSLHDAAFATGMFPLGGMRTRAYRAGHYLIADGAPENAFVHVEIRIGHGRNAAGQEQAVRAVFDAATAFLAPAFSACPLGLSVQLTEADPVLNLKKNTLHAALGGSSHGEKPT